MQQHSLLPTIKKRNKKRKLQLAAKAAKKNSAQVPGDQGSDHTVKIVRLQLEFAGIGLKLAELLSDESSTRVLEIAKLQLQIAKNNLELATSSTQ
jgi:hypothetical protein